MRLRVSISEDGNTLAASALGESSAASGVGGNQSDNSLDSGAAYVFTRTGFTWAPQAYLKASNPGSQDAFGIGLALSGDGNTLAVGATLEDSNSIGIDGLQGDNSASASGAVYVFARNGVVWAQQAYIKAGNTESFDSFGFALDLSADGSRLFVGAYGEDSAAIGFSGAQLDNSVSDSGAAYLFRRNGPNWLQDGYLKSSNTGFGDAFGRAISISSNGLTLAVGADSERSSATGVGGDQQDNSAVDSGAVYLY